MSLRLWLQAARPRTLTGAAAPVLVGLSSAWHESGSLRLWPALGCLLFALLMQIDANLFNDWWDCRKGVDTRVPRLGPVRLCAAGLIPMRSMQRAVVLVTVLSALVGLTLFWHSFSLETQMPLGLPAPLLMLLTGAACLLSFAAYSTFFSRLALGDVLVVVFFGLVPVVCTCLLQDVAATPSLWRQAFAVGLATDALLVVNNYRDREGDRLTGKLTLCTLIGPRLSRALYLLWVWLLRRWRRRVFISARCATPGRPCCSSFISRCTQVRGCASGAWGARRSTACWLRRHAIFSSFPLFLRQYFGEGLGQRIVHQFLPRDPSPVLRQLTGHIRHRAAPDFDAQQTVRQTVADNVFGLHPV